MLCSRPGDSGHVLAEKPAGLHVQKVAGPAQKLSVLRIYASRYMLCGAWGVGGRAHRWTRCGAWGRGAWVRAHRWTRCRAWGVGGRAHRWARCGA